MATWDLQSLLWHAGHLVAAGEILIAACGIWFPDQGSHPCSLDWDLRVLATGPAGKSPPDVFNVHSLWLEDRQGFCWLLLLPNR